VCNYKIESRSANLSTDDDINGGIHCNSYKEHSL